MGNSQHGIADYDGDGDLDFLFVGEYGSVTDIAQLIINQGNSFANGASFPLSTVSEGAASFGDYNNDLEMMSKATYSFAMQNAHPNVKAIANYTTKTNDENGVEYMLKKMIAAKRTS